uniref:Ig-like domain-containing protein n=1 Tax=Oncorhynchus kisutch TaxID=8019 RepID=A0A8C7FCK3_ONCKI
ISTLGCPTRFVLSFAFYFPVCVHSRYMKDAEDARSKCGDDSVLYLGSAVKGINTTQWYAGLEREVELLADHSFDIFLLNVTAVDSGRYKCLSSVLIYTQCISFQCIITFSFAGCLDNKSTDQSEESNTILVLSIVGLMAALPTISSMYFTFQQLLDAPFEKKDLMLIYTLGPNWSGQASLKHDVCV